MAEDKAKEQVAESTPAAEQAQFAIEKLYLKDLSLESPNAPEMFLERAAPQVEMKLQNQGRQVGDGLYECVLTVTLSAKVGERTAYLVEVAQAGLFRIANVTPDVLQLILQITCPNMLFPYAREAVSEMIGRAGYQAIYLAPVNFETLYQQQRAQQDAQAGAASQSVN